MTNKQTPGPWYKSTAENGLAVICHRNSDGDERVIARLSSRQEIGDEVPDADLISAAPELLAALQMILQLNPQLPMGVTEDAEAAVSKATGDAK